MKQISIDDWIVEAGERGHGFSIAAFPTEQAAINFLTNFNQFLQLQPPNEQIEKLHVIQGKEILEIRMRTIIV